MRILQQFLLAMMSLASQAAMAYAAPAFPYSPAAGQYGSKAVAHDDDRIKGWAIKVETIVYGEEVAEEWKNPEEALGPTTVNMESVLVLGRGGEVVLSFGDTVVNGPGDDFAIFENPADDTFLELAYVEVSSDGVHFVRFPNYSLTGSPVGGFGRLQPTFVHGYASKYRIGFGTPFDLETLVSAHSVALTGGGGFSLEFREQLLEGFPYLDPEAIRFVRIIDIPGDGSRFDSEGFPIYDPYPTVITSGFDLDAIAVFNFRAPTVVSFSDWSNGYGLEANPMTDTDGDKWNQYMEYLFGSDPRDEDSKPEIRQEILVKDGSNILRMDYARNGLSEQSPVIETSVDGITWLEWTENPEVIHENRTASEYSITERSEVPCDSSEQLLFVRFSVGK